MFYRLLLVDGQGGARAPPLHIRILRQVPDLDGISVHFRPVRSDGLFESATVAGRLAYHILRGEGIVRSQLWIEYEVPGERLSVAGRSSDLLFALALITAAWTVVDERELTIAATGVLNEEGAVLSVDHPLDKMAAAVAALSGAGKAVIFYPLSERESVESWQSSVGVPPTITLRPVAHVDEALAYLGYVLDKVYLHNPFRGLEHFNYEHHAVFYGRDDEVRELVRQLLRREAYGTPGLLIEGPSGSGKSSLLRAGVLPALIEPRHQPQPVRSLLAQCPVSHGARGAVWRPGLLSAGADERAITRSIRDCWRSFQELPPSWGELDTGSLLELAHHRREHWTGQSRFVWLIDQFEEILSLKLDDTVFEILGRFLAALQADNVWTLISVRADAMPTIKRYAAIREVFGANEGQYYLTSLSGLALADVITCPARASALVFGVTPDGKRLDQLLLEEAYRESDGLPLLQFTLNELYLKRSGNELSCETFQQLGGLAGSIATTATAVLDADEEGSRHTFPRLCRSLVSVDERGRATRRYAPLSEIDEGLMPLVQRLVDARLCVTDQRGGQAVVAFAHDSLLRTLPALTDWLREEAGLLQTRELAQRDAALWREHGETDAWLAASDRLVAFKGLDAAGLGLSSEIRSFIAASERQMRRKARIKQAVVCLIALLAASASVGAWIASRKQHEAERQSAQTQQAQARLLTEAASERLKDGDLAYARGIILEVLRYETATGGPSPAAVNVFQESRASDPALAILSGHEASVLSARYSPDGARIVTASADHSARIWDARTGVELQRLSGHTGAVKSAAFSADGAHVVTASTDGTARIWDAHSGTQLLVIHDPDSPDTGLDSRQMFDASGLSSATFAPDSDRIVTTGSRVARVWDARTGAQLAVLVGHTGGLTSASFSPDGGQIVTSSADRTARVWDARSGALLRVLAGHRDALASAEYSPDGRHVVTASNDETARVWDALTGDTLAVLKGHVGYVWHATYSPDGTTIATIGTDKTARIWDARSGAPIKVIPGHVGILYNAAYSPDGTHLVTASYDGTARVWKLAGSHARVLAGHADRVISVAYSPDGKRLVTGSEDRTARVWDTNSGAQLLVLSGHGGAVNSVAYSADGARIVTSAADKVARIWDARTGRLLLATHCKDGSYAAAFSPDGSRFIVGARLSFGVWDAHTGARLTLRTGHTDDLTSVAYSPDGARILTASDDKTARIWDASDYAQLGVLPHDEFVNDARYSRNGTRIVTASDDRTARIWDARSGAQLQVLLGNHAYVQSAALSDDGSRAVTGGRDDAVRIFDARTGIELAVLVGHSDRIFSVAYSPDGTHVASGAADKTARIWDAAIPSELSAQLTWAQAAEADPVADVQRSQLALSPATTLLTDATVGAGFGAHSLTHFAPSAGPTDCSREAGAIYDPDRNTPGLQLAAINAEIANSVCGRAARTPGASAQTLYQAGRALLARTDYEGAREHFERAVSQGYRAAQIDLAELLLNPSAEVLDYPRAVSLLERAWKQGVSIAAFELGRLYERGTTASEGARVDGTPGADSTRAWFWYEKGAAVHEPYALARCAERDERRALGAPSAQESHSWLLEALRLYVVAAQVARSEQWPDAVWRKWLYRRATLARLLGEEGMMDKVAETYIAAMAGVR